MAEPEFDYQFLDDAEKNADKEEEEVENDKKLEKEDKIELQEILKQIKDTTESWKTTKEDFEKSTEPGVIKKIGVFLLAASVTATIFYFITFGLKKATTSDNGGSSGGGSDDEENKRKAAILAALSEVSKDVQNISRLLSVWFTAHQDEKIKDGDVHIPLIDIFSDYTDKMTVELTAIETNMKTLTDNDNGKLQFSVPSLILVNTVLTHYGNYIAILPGLLAFAQDKAKTYDTVKTFPLKQTDIDTVKKDYDVARKLPY